MREIDVAIVGGGPAGSACARELVQAGVDVIVLDRAAFPRTKLCAGWITPEVVEDLALDVSAYPHSFMTFEHIHAHIKGLRFKLSSVQHSIRRYEFDHYLLERAGVPVDTHYVRRMERADGHYVIDETYRCRFLVGAAGTKCPVYRTFFRDASPRARTLQTVTYEQEFAYAWGDPDCHLWFLDNGLPGYAWYVPKANGHLNVGIGGLADKLKRRGGDIKTHWGLLTEKLSAGGFVRDIVFDPAGYSYYLRSDVEVVRVDDAFIVGDAIGLATRDLCEGIGPAVRSGILAARAIIDDTEYSLASIARYSAENRLIRRGLEYAFLG